MSATYSVTLTSPFGDARLAEISDFLSLTYSPIVNGIGKLTLTLDADMVPWDYLQRDMRIGVWRSLDGGPQYLDCDKLWLLRRRRRAIQADRRRIVTLEARCMNDVLRRRIVAYAAASSQAAKTATADNMMKAIMRENLGSSATDTARSLATYLAVQADQGLGPSLTKAFSRREVLKTLQEISMQATTAGTPIYFDIVAAGTGALEFQTFLNQRGTDHSTTGIRQVVVSPERDNLADATQEDDWADEATYIYAGGQGQEANRQIATASDTARIGASPWNRIERFVNATQAGTTASLQAEADQALRDGRPFSPFAGTLVDTEGTRYGRDWAFGDKIVAEFEGSSFACKVDALRVAVLDGEETITASLRAEG
jgi:hypothetical protein